VFRFLARGIAFWHFKGEFDFDGFVMESSFEDGDKELMEPLILKMLEYSLSEDYTMDYEAAVLVIKLALMSAEPFLVQALKKIQYVGKNNYDSYHDMFNWFRKDSADALGAIRAYGAAPALLEALKVEPDADVLEGIIRSLGALKYREAIPYMKGIWHHSIGNYHSEDERELREAVLFALNVLKAEPKNQVEFAAERIVFFQYDYFDEDELSIFFSEFPTIKDDQYEELFLHTLDQLVLAGENFHQYDDSESFLRYTSRMFLYLNLSGKVPHLEKIISKIKDKTRRTIAQKLVEYFPEEEKNLIKDDFELI
ncbi:MAG: HEAT repeat domain-containing protein, partial [Candidatus Heimdallarchaeota archaeon]|nr:HEAT repeat domain-containing protein [Candidatus Heimdallarchaeota archaeon]